jgi:hypothetical protein
VLAGRCAFCAGDVGTAECELPLDSDVRKNSLAETRTWAAEAKEDLPSEALGSVCFCGFVNLHHDDGPDGFAALHQIKAVVELLQLQAVRDQRVERDLLVHIPIDDLWQLV